jgi:hypothetical protein
MKTKKKNNIKSKNNITTSNFVKLLNWILIFFYKKISIIVLYHILLISGKLSIKLFIFKNFANLLK